MTQPRALAATIARRIFDRIERDKTLILQNIEDEIHDALVLEGARRATPPEADINEYQRQIQKILQGEYQRYKPSEFVTFTRRHPREKWWQDAPGPEAGE